MKHLDLLSKPIDSVNMENFSSYLNIKEGRISLNGDYVNIGTGQDLLYENADNEHIKICIYDNDDIRIAALAEHAAEGAGNGGVLDGERLLGSKPLNEDR